MRIMFNSTAATTISLEHFDGHDFLCSRVQVTNFRIRIDRKQQWRLTQRPPRERRHHSPQVLGRLSPRLSAGVVDLPDISDVTFSSSDANEEPNDNMR